MTIPRVYWLLWLSQVSPDYCDYPNGPLTIITIPSIHWLTMTIPNIHWLYCDYTKCRLTTDYPKVHWLLQLLQVSTDYYRLSQVSIDCNMAHKCPWTTLWLSQLFIYCTMTITSVLWLLWLSQVSTDCNMPHKCPLTAVWLSQVPTDYYGGVSSNVHSLYWWINMLPTKVWNMMFYCPRILWVSKLCRRFCFTMSQCERFTENGGSMFWVWAGIQCDIQNVYSLS